MKGKQGDDPAVEDSMDVDERKLSALKGVSGLLTELAQIIGVSKRNKELMHAFHAIQMWEERTEKELARLVSSGEANRFKQKRLNPASNWDSIDELLKQAKKHHEYLNALAGQMSHHPEVFFSTAAHSDPGAEPGSDSGKQAKTPAARILLITFTANPGPGRELETLLKHRWDLEPILIDWDWEQWSVEQIARETRQASFVFVLLDDDSLHEPEEKPGTPLDRNAFFVLGWLCGHVGTNNVCVIWEPGSDISHPTSDLKWLQLKGDLDEHADEIEQILASARMIVE